MFPLNCLLAFWTITSSGALQESDLPWTYQCQDGRCQRTIYNSQTSGSRQSLDTCKLRCGAARTLWPMPNPLPADITTEIFRFCPGQVRLSLSGSTGPRQTKVINGQFQGLKGVFKPDVTCKQSKRSDIVVTVKLTGLRQEDQFFDYDTDESYTINIQSNDTNNQIQMGISAPNKFGTRHAFETMKQLIVYDTLTNCFVTLKEVSFTDKPAYPHRGVMLDTSRNFFSVDNIMLLLEAMSLFKLNTFHWHITDSHSFPYNTPVQPELAFYGAYNDAFQYTPEDVANVADFALTHGIRVIPEIDMPAHVGYGWQWGEQAGLGKMVLCEGMSPWEYYCLQAPCGQFNPINENVYPILEKLFSDLYNATRSKIFHIGGDEVKFECWNDTKEIVDFLENNGYDLSGDTYHQLWGNFTLRSYAALARAYKMSVPGANDPNPPNAIFWTSTLTDGDYLRRYFDPATAIVMYWEDLAAGRYIEGLLQSGYRVILANHDRNYMDCGYAHYVTDGNTWCSPYKNWTDVYDNNYLRELQNLSIGVANLTHLVMGGQILLWTEVADQSGFLYKFLPRLMALAERWWSFSTSPIDYEVKNRFEYIQHRFAENMGSKFRPDLVAPAWCVQNPQSCE